MIKFVSIADAHIRNLEPLGLKEGDFDTRTNKKLSLLDETIDYAIEKSCDLYVILGDLFHEINIKKDLRLAVIKSLSKLTKNNIDVWYLVGNHETDGQTNIFQVENEFLETFTKNGKLFRIFNDRRIIKYKNFEFVILPWDRDIEEVKRAIQKLKPVDCILGHLPICGSSIVDEIDDKKRFVDTFGIDASTLQARCIQFGHYHNKQSYYIGALTYRFYTDTTYVTPGFSYTELDEISVKSEWILVKEHQFVKLKFVEPSIPKIPQDSQNKVVLYEIYGKQEYINNIEFSKIRKTLVEGGVRGLDFRTNVVENKIISTTVPLEEINIPKIMQEICKEKVEDIQQEDYLVTGMDIIKEATKDI